MRHIGGEAGARVTVHHRRTLPHPNENGYLASTGRLTSIGVKKVILRRKDAPHGTCTHKKKLQNKDMFSEKYSKTHYSKQARIRYSIKYY